MEQIILKAGTINPEKVTLLQDDLKRDFYNTRAKFFKADLPKQEFGRPKHVFPAHEAGKSNYITLKVASRDCIEFYKTAMKSTAVFYRENFNTEDAAKIMRTLQRHDFIQPPEHPKPVYIPTMPVQKPFYAQFFDWIKGFLSK